MRKPEAGNRRPEKVDASAGGNGDGRKMEVWGFGPTGKRPAANSRQGMGEWTRPATAVRRPSSESKLVVVDYVEGRGFLVLGNATFEEVLFLLDIHHFGEPRQRVLNAGGERGQADAFEAPVGDVVNVLGEVLGAEADGIHGQAVADELLLERDGLGHQ